MAFEKAAWPGSTNEYCDGDSASVREKSGKVVPPLVASPTRPIPLGGDHATPSRARAFGGGG